MDVLRFLLRSPFTLLRAIGWTLSACFRILGLLLTPLIGRVQWRTPGWLRFIGYSLLWAESGVNRYPKATATALVLLAAAGAGGYYGYHWHLNRPVPIDPAPLVVQQTNVRLQPPSAVNYRADKAEPQRIVLRFSRSAAPIERIGKTVTEGLTLTPTAEGEWKWQDDHTLTFTASKALPMGQEYRLTLEDKRLVAPQIELTQREYTFITEPFDYRLHQTEFYQDPRDPQKKNAIISVTFNAPIDVQSFEKRLALHLLSNPKMVHLSPTKYNVVYNDKSPLKYTVVYDDKKLQAWIHSEQISPSDNRMQAALTIDRGIAATVAANSATQTRTYSVDVPSLYSLNVLQIDSQLIETENGKDARALIVSLSDVVNEKAMAAGVKAWLLPKRMPDEKEPVDEEAIHAWRLDEIDEAVLSQSDALPIKMSDNEQENQVNFSFAYGAPANRYLLVKVSSGLTSAGGYRLKDDDYKVVRVPDYPQTLRFVSEGALLSMKGEKRITVAARNLPGLKLDIKRVIPSQLQHIVSFKNRTFTSVGFNRLNDEYFTEHFSYETALSNDNPGDIQYQGIDLGRYLTNDPKSKRGIFLLSLKPWDPKKGTKNNAEAEYDGNDPDAVREYEEEEYDEEEQENATDSRFVIVTDLGIMAKTSIDGSRDVFVQSIHSGAPVSGATVSVVAKNGTTLLSKTTGEDGHAAFPSLSDFRFEQTAVMFLVEKEGDVSFLPTNAYYDRQLELSRFDIYGESTPQDPRTLSSYLFSDRGVYRPGETFNIGLITRTADWKTSVAGIPLRAEVRDPRDAMMATFPLTLDAAGFNELSYTTSENSPTGDWTIYLYLVGTDNKDARLLGSTTVKVKEFEPDRLKVALTLTPDRQQGWVKPSELKAEIDVQNLFGTPAQDRRVTSKLTLRPVYPSFSRFSNYQFYENRRSSDSFDTELEERTTDADGKASISLGLDAYGDATYQLQLISEAFEAGSGRSVTAAARVMVSPYDYLVGVKADGSLDYISHRSERRLNLIAVDPSLKQRALQGLKAELLEQKYLSVLTRQNSGVYKYQSKLKETPVAETALAIGEEGTDFTLNTEKPGNFVLVIKSADDKVLNRVAYTVAGNANVSRSLERNAELTLTLNKDAYRPGENIEVAINAPYSGSGFITIERDKVYHWQWFHASTTSSVQTIRIPPDMEGNGYINVQFIRDPNSDEVFMSPLSYGVEPFKISHEARQAKIELESPEVIKPGDTLSIKVKTDSAQRVAVFAVDEGILQVARYRLKDPLDYFFRKRALEVESDQILDLILPEFSKMMSLTSAPGGDAGESIDLHLNPFKRKKDAPVTYWSGIADVNGEAELKYHVPDYFNGKLRIMAVAVTPDRIGHAQRYTTVRDDFVLSPNVPTTVSPGDQFDVTLGVANNLTGLNGEKTALEVAIAPPPQLEVVGNASYSLSLAEKREGVVTFRLKAKEHLGNASIKFTARSGDKSASRTVSLSLRPAAPYRTQSVMGRMDGSQQSVRDIRQMYDAFAKRNARVSWSPLVLTNGLAQYLADYPNACSEQIVSQAVPLLFQQRHPEMKNGRSQEEVRSQLKKTMATLLARQNGRGAIGAWRSSPNADPFVTPYVVQFLLEAQQADYPVSDALQKSANGYLKQLAANDAMHTLDDLRLRAFAVYLLTRQGEVTTGQLAAVQTRLQKSYPDVWLKDLGALYLAASYKMLKMDKQADALLQPTWDELSKGYDKAWWTRDYLDPLVQDSTRLYLIVRHFPEKAASIPPQLLENMVLRLKEERYTTYSSAMTIMALEYYTAQAKTSAAEGKGLTVSVKQGEEGPKAISTLSGATAIANFDAGISEVLFSNQSSNPVWYVVTQAGYDRSLPTQSIARGLEITRDYVNEKGEIVNSVALGDKIYVRLKIRANAKEGLDNLAIVDLLPGGFEVVQQSEESAGASSDDGTEASWQSPLAASGSTWRPSYSDIREDRVIIYGSATERVQEFVYQIKATNSGIFTVPPAFGEAMYDREIQALAVGTGTLTVTEPVAIR